MKKAPIARGLFQVLQSDSVGLAAQESRNLDAFLIGGQFLFVVIGGHRRLLAACLRAFLGRFGVATRHAVDQAADAEARAFSRFCNRGGCALRRPRPSACCR